MIKLITRSPLKRAIYCTECKDISHSFRMDRKLPLTACKSLLWGLSLLSVALYYVDRISPNHPPTPHVQASDRPVTELAVEMWPFVK